MPEQSSLDLVDVLSDLEAKLSDRGRCLTEALGKPGANAATVVKALLDELQRVKSGGAPPDGGLDSSSAPEPHEDQVLAAISGRHSGPFRSITTALAALDLQDPKGQIDALAVGFDGDCVLAVKTLLSRSPSGDRNAGRHPTLGILTKLRQYRLNYFNWHLRVNENTGEVPMRMREYSLANETGDRPNTALLEALLDLRFEGTDWIKAPHGCLGWKQRQNNSAAPMAYDPRDYYCIPELLSLLCQFLHKLLVSIGAATTSTLGYTMITLGEFFCAHLHMSSKLATKEQMVAWIQRSSDTFALTLLRVGQHMRSIVDSRTPGEETLNTYILPFNHEVLAELKSAETLLDEFLEKQAMEMRLTGSSSSSAVSSASLVLPLLSEHGGSGATNPKKGKGAEKLSSLSKQQKRKSENGSETLILGVDGGLPHGCMAQAWRYVNGGKNLISSGKNFDILPIAKHLGVKPTGTCWPFVLSLCEDKNRLSRCKKLKDSNHSSNESSAHVLCLPAGKTFNRDEIVAKFSKIATAQERQGLATSPSFSGRGRGRGDDGRGRGRGRGKGRGGDGVVDPNQTEDDDEEEDGQSFRQPSGP